MPGILRSMPYTILPSTLSRVSSRLSGLPISFHSFGSLSFTSFGTSSFAAASATWPYLSRRLLGVCVMTLFAAVHSWTGTFHWLAAAWTSITRAVAPPRRTYSCDSRMPRLPPVEKSPQARLRFTLSPGVGYSILTLDQLHSSSSATSCARPVIVPCPISERTTRMLTVSSGPIATQTPTPGEPSCARATAGPNGRRSPNAKPPVTAAEPTINERRFILMCRSLCLGRCVDRFPYLLEGAAAADVGDRGVDVRVGGLGLLLEQRRHRHDH